MYPSNVNSIQSLLIYLTGSVTFNEQAIIAEKNEIKKEKKSLEKEVSKLYSDDEYLIKYARTHYIFLKEDEHVVELPNIQNFQNTQSVKNK